MVSVSSMMAARDQTTIGAYRQQTIERVFGGLLSAPLRRDGAEAGRAVPGRGDAAAASSCNSAEATTLSALVADGGVERGLAALFTEADRVARFGFTQTELDRYRLQPACRPSSSSPPPTTSTRRESLADEFIRNFMQQEPIPGIAYENGLVQRFLPEITLADVNSLARDWVPDRNRVVAVSAPKKAGVAVPGRGEARGRHQERRRRRADRVRGHRQRAAAPRDAAQAGHGREDARRRRRASPSGRCRTACASCSSRRRSSRTRSCSARSAPAARRSPAIRISSPPKRRTRSSSAGRARHAERHRCEQEARGQGRGRASRHRGDVRRAERPGAAPRSRDDVPVDLPDVHAAARRSRRRFARRPGS